MVLGKPLKPNDGQVTKHESKEAMPKLFLELKEVIRRIENANITLLIQVFMMTK